MAAGSLAAFVTAGTVIEALAQDENIPPILFKRITRYRARGAEPIDMSENSKDILPSYIADPNSITEEKLDGVKTKVVDDITYVVESINKGEISIKDLGNFGDIVILDADNMGVSLDKVNESLGSAKLLKGKITDDKHLYEDASGDVPFALATLYDAGKTTEQQILTGVTSAGRGRQLFKAMSESIVNAKGQGNVDSITKQMEDQLGFSSLNGKSGSEFSISCWTTMANVKNPSVYNKNHQEAWYLEQGSDLYNQKYPSAELKVGSAREVDLKDNGQGRMLLTSDETILVIMRVDSNGKFRVLVTGLSDNLIDYDGERSKDHAAGSEWRPCGPVSTKPKQPAPTNIPGNPNTPPEKTKIPPTNALPTPAPTNPGRPSIPTATQGPAPTNVEPTVQATQIP